MKHCKNKSNDFRKMLVFTDIYKDEHFITDITNMDVSFYPLAIGSKGYISLSNKANLKKLPKFCKPSVSFKAMCENLSSLAVLSSYHIFRKRKTLDWDQETPFLKTISVNH